jgi:hypothetical protein
MISELSQMDSLAFDNIMKISFEPGKIKRYPAIFVKNRFSGFGNGSIKNFNQSGT